MLKAKPKRCKKCGMMKAIWSKGMCQQCSASKPLRSSGKLARTSSLKKKRKGKTSEIRDFYRGMVSATRGVPVYSAESGALIAPVQAVNLAHIFPKESYPSVATNIQNIVFFTWEEHTRFDELLGRHEFEKLEREFPNSWPYICSLVEKLLPQVEEIKPLRIKLEEYIYGNQHDISGEEGA